MEDYSNMPVQQRLVQCPCPCPCGPFVDATNTYFRVQARTVTARRFGVVSTNRFNDLMTKKGVRLNVQTTIDTQRMRWVVDN